MNSYTGTTGLANETFYGVYASAFAGTSLISVLIVIGVAAVIIGLIIWAFSLFAASGAAE